ncbi:MAG: hypothetical protein JXA22_00835 [Candidatus Thermoplasmatota archaeon]|nr:hypothetical protein [Candidatus Thermoplasmatota archaeon]
MNGRSVPQHLEMILDTMNATRKEEVKENVLRTVHFRTSFLHGTTVERCPVSVKIGKKERARRSEVPFPFLTTASLMKSLPNNARLGIALGQAMSGIPLNIYPGVPPEIYEILKTHRPGTVVCFGPDRQDIDIDMLKSADLTEIEIMDMSDIPPRLVPEVRKGKDIIRLVDMIKEASDAPILMSIDQEQLNSDIDFYLVSDIDIIGLRCGDLSVEHCDSRMMLASVIGLLRKMEVFKSVEKGLQVMLNGYLMTSEDMVKMMAFGVDLICLDLLTMDFIKAYLRNKMNIPVGERIDLEDHDDSLDWAEIGEMYSEWMTMLSEGIRDTLAELNIGSVADLGPDRLVTSDYNTSAITGIPLAGFEAQVPFWRYRS